MSEQREMTLDEYLESKLPDSHLARRQLQELREEREALSEHVEWMQRAFKAAMVSGWSIPIEGAPIEVFSDSPRVSLARLKVRWQVEALDHWLSLNLHGERFEYLYELRRQAKGGEA